jgi:hypothetical protein
VVSMHEFACLIDHLDKCLECRGQVVVKNPDVWGQNRLTQHRAEYEDQMKAQLGNFETVLSSYQRRSDATGLSSGTSIGASVGPPSKTATTTPSVPSATGLLGPSGLVDNANTLIGTASPLLMPSNLTGLALSNKGAATGIGLESTVLLDERSDFLQHLHQLRRNNAGDDRTDMPGCGLYLVRMPVSILPGAESIKGKGAVVTVQAKHHLTPDLLATTFRNVVILDTTYALLDAVTRGQYLPVGDDQNVDSEANPSSYSAKPQNPCSGIPQPPVRRTPAGGPAALSRYNAMSLTGGGSLRASSGSTGSSTETVALYGRENLNKLISAVKVDQESWFRHDPSVVSWLFNELAAAHDYMREQSRLGNPLFQPVAFEELGNLALTRNYQDLKAARQRWLQSLAAQRNEQQDAADTSVLRVRPMDILAFALMVQSIYVDRQLKYDMQTICQRKDCDLGDPYQYSFFNLYPDSQSQCAFNKYVECKWPIHVFSLDPIVEQQNQLDLFSQRSELQLAVATAIASGQASFQNATSYARRLEQDLAAIALNRTAVGFGAGDATFGWRFYPRYQTPPTQSTPRRIVSTLVNNGPSSDYARNNLHIEPGQRECYALMVVPNFAPQLKLTTITNWFDLKTCHPGQELATTDMLDLSLELQTARSAMQRLCDSGRYRPVDLELLGDRLNQLEAMLPMQSHDVLLPFEADLTASEIFTSFNAALGPRLLTWFGEPGQTGGSIFILGTGFSVRDMKVIVGGVTVLDSGSAQASATGPAPPTFDIVSRNVLRVDLPASATPIRTPVVYKDPTVVCFDQGSGKSTDGVCDDCAKLNGASQASEVAFRQADVLARQAVLTDAQQKLQAAQYADGKAQAALVTAQVAFAAKQLAAKDLQAARDICAATSLAVLSATAAVQSVEAQVKAAEAIVKKTAAPVPGSPPIECQCKQRWVIDVHVASSNGVSNHLLVEVPHSVNPPSSSPSASAAGAPSPATPPAPAPTTPPKTGFNANHKDRNLVQATALAPTRLSEAVATTNTPPNPSPTKKTVPRARPASQPPERKSVLSRIFSGER